jgi:flagellar assembly factor FliW
MIIEGTRFGTIEVNDDRMITMPAGMIGFANETRFVLLEPKEGRNTGWLQSVDNPELAFPVMNAAALSPAYPPSSLKDTARNAGVNDDDLAVLIVVVARKNAPRLVANLLAPVVIGANSRTGAQIVLDHRHYSAAAPLAA